MKRLYLLLPLLLVLGCSKNEDPLPANVEQGLVKNIPTLSEIYKNGTLVKKYLYNAKRLSAVETPTSELVVYFFEPSVWTISREGGVKNVHEYRYDANNLLLFDEWTRNDVPVYRRNYIYEKNVLVKIETVAYPPYPYNTQTIYKYSTPWEYSLSFVPVIDGVPMDVSPSVYIKWRTPFVEELYNDLKQLDSRDHYSVLIKAPDFNIPVTPTSEVIKDHISIGNLFFNRMAPPSDQKPGLLVMKHESYLNGQLNSRVTKEKIKLNRHGLPDSYDEVTRNAAGQITKTDSWRFVYVEL
ncbi:MAG: hypothetical protein WBP58_03585 [Chitinophagaceae bacterium]